MNLYQELKNACESADKPADESVEAANKFLEERVLPILIETVKNKEYLFLSNQYLLLMQRIIRIDDL